MLTATRSIDSIMAAKTKEKIYASIDKRSDISRQQIKALLRMDTMKKQDNKTPQPSASTSDDLMIMAFICKRLPLSPNPDPSLHW